MVWLLNNYAVPSVIQGSAGIQVNTVFQCPAREGQVSPSVNPSLLFISSQHCLLTTGSSSSVYLLHTPCRVPSGGEDAPSGESKEELWMLVEELKLHEEEPASILSACYCETEQQLSVVTMTLHSVHITSTEGKEEKTASKPPIATYNWYRFSIDLHSYLAQSSSSSQQKEKEESIEPDLVCRLQSSTMALYGAFASNHHLIILSEGDVLPPTTLAIAAATESVTETEIEGETGTAELEGLAEETQAGEAEDKKFKGLGFEGEGEENRKVEKMDSEKKEGEGEKREGEGEKREGEGEKMEEEGEKREGEGEKREGEGEKREEEGEKGEEEEQKSEGSSEEPQYQWSQREGDITITVPLPSDVSKRDINCVISRREIVVGLSDGTTYLRGRLFAPISSDCSTWTLEKHT